MVRQFLFSARNTPKKKSPNLYSFLPSDDFCPISLALSDKSHYSFSIYKKSASAYDTIFVLSPSISRTKLVMIFLIIPVVRV